MIDAALTQAQFQNPDLARQFLEAQVWPKGPVCPHCGVIGEHYQLKGKSNRPGLWKCKDCREPFTVTVGTVFERSHVPLNKWLMAVYLLCSSKKGISAHQLHRTLGVSYKTAWFMAHRIREAMKGDSGLLGGAGKIVEADEAYIGTAEGKKKARAGFGHKNKILSLVERGGAVRSLHVASVTSKNLKPILLGNIHPDTHLQTDQANHYLMPGKEFKKHSSVNHAMGEYVRGQVTTNTVEGFFSILKRGLIGTYQHVSPAHLQRYCVEFDFRYNTRVKLGINDSERAATALKGIVGKRLTYRRIDDISQANQG